ncbi:competence protein [Streptococcus cristatus]|uniref:Competence protein n=1 Tax=Streptococcus cristatus TaxID=45634 RepID=A0A5B0DFN8_STRCR|nr:competence protein [Streptococcus cristatus]KAA0964621.1 competence protein [Streptococcus cristatus]
MKNTQENFKAIVHFPALNEKELKEVLGGDLRNIFLKIKFKKK